MKLRTFSVRTAKEILRDPLTLFFGLGFPLILLLLLTAIQANIPVELFRNRAADARYNRVRTFVYDPVFGDTYITRQRKRAFAKIIYHAAHGGRFYTRLHDTDYSYRSSSMRGLLYCRICARDEIHRFGIVRDPFHNSDICVLHLSRLAFRNDTKC